MELSDKLETPNPVEENYFRGNIQRYEVLTNVTS